ncbi:hypothetical protein AAG570_008918 [Ranatra chinensis]|uniref:Uncharacterized protein n=1 Tax=Ranatra chinensis TaxID=642074 RepID=A0ABD0YSC2_9HEMI
MAPKCRNMFVKNTKQEMTEIGMGMDPSPDVDVDSKEVLGATNFESSEVPVEEEPSDTSEKTIEKDPQDDNLCVSLEKLKIEGSSIPSVSSANDNTKTSDDNLKLDQKESQEKDSNKKNILSSREDSDRKVRPSSLLDETDAHALTKRPRLNSISSAITHR